MSTPPTFSVVVTAHNHRDYILEAVRGALDQGLAAAEVVVVDDGSTDGTAGLLAGANLPARCRVVSQPNAGQLAAVATGFRHTTGDIVCLLDSDDVWRPDYLAQLAALYAKRPDVDLVFSDVEVFGSRAGRDAFFGEARDCGTTMLITWFQGHWEMAPTSGMSIRRRYLQRVLEVPSDLFERWRISADTCINIGASILGARKYFLPTGAVRYRVHAHNHWAGQRSNAKRLREWVNNRSTRNYFGERMHFSLEHLNELCAEFATHPTPCHDDFRRYATANWKAPVSLYKRMERYFRLYRHYRANRRDTVAPPRALSMRGPSDPAAAQP